jgi:ATP-independent RNA helicase DbpA
VSTSLLFESLSISAGQKENLKANGYLEMTPIQQQTLPSTLAGKDILAQAATGSGKTLAFGLPLVERLNPTAYFVQALVLCPTRELAGQVAEELRKLARYPGNIKVLTICGGQPIGPQIGSLEHGAHVIVGTPGRIVDHLRKRTLDLSRISTLVLDEADRMLDMGFQDDLQTILNQTPTSRQTLLFSATYPENIAQMSEEHLKNPVEVRIEQSPEKISNITHRVYECERSEQALGVLSILTQQLPESAIIFCNTKEGCNQLSQALREDGIKSGTLHGDLEQRDRDQMLVRFSNGSIRFLIATDVAARGLDIDTVDLVINADLPSDAATYVHRCGRTGRAGRSGLAVSLAGSRDGRRLENINRENNLALEPKPLPKAAINQVIKLQSDLRTIAISMGRKNKIRPGDIVGALTATKEIAGNQIGSIQVQDFTSYVAVPRTLADRAVEILRQRPLKGKPARARKI